MSTTIYEYLSINSKPSENSTSRSRARKRKISSSRQCAPPISTFRGAPELPAEGDSRGAADLKLFLDYAEHRGVRRTAPQNVRRGEVQELVESAAKFLRQNGYEVHTRVGFSRTCIDAAIVDPNDKNSYVVGIEFDGPTYRDAETARDRVLLRQQILEGLGWEIVRVWTPAWIFNAERARKKLLDDVENAIKKARGMKQPRARGEYPTHLSEDEIAPLPPMIIIREVYSNLKYLEQTRSHSMAMSSTMQSDYMSDQISRIVFVEGPILEQTLEKRLRFLWNVDSQNDEFQRQIKEALKKVKIQSDVDDDGKRVYWRNDATPSAYWRYRVPNSQGGKRDFSEIPLCELRNALFALAAKDPKSSEEELRIQTASVFGFNEMTPEIIERLKKI